ncbi:hypothetical protein [Clostridium pasteurianum]|uniref:hypothetical protein n=1 Tax=Clostridium pasteurianum TaxID=1501 RepID=UPI001FA7E621|nr:hypothetical protein [Clostridium pasteurianum]
MNSLKNDLDSSSEKIAEVRISLRVENNNKFVRGKKKVKENIEKYLKHYYNMQESGSTDTDYIIFVKYKSIDDLKNTVYEILRDLDSEAYQKNCFTEGDAHCDELGLTW